MTGEASQRTLGWYRSRLGCITGSRVGELMKRPRGKKEGFSDAAMSYIYQLAAERSMNPAFVNDDTLFGDYLSSVSISSQAMRFGTEMEGYARGEYERATGRRIFETGSCRHRTIPHFASSPDGLYCGGDSLDRGAVEIKCPSQHVYMRYVSEIHDSLSLLEAEPRYFYQCMSHILCCRVRWTDFIAYCPFQRNPIHIVRIYPVRESIDEMKRRIREADMIVESLVSAIGRQGHENRQGDLQDVRIQA